MRIAAISWIGSALALSVLTPGVVAGPLLAAPTEANGLAPAAILGSSPLPIQGSDPGFLFRRPRVGITLRGGMFFHRADSDLHEFSEERFTLERSDFRGVAVGAEVAAWVGAKTELALGIDGSRVTIRSEARDWLEEDGSPILQSTRLTHGPSVSFGARRYLRDRGEQLGRFIWIPGGWNAFIGVGGAVTGYRFEQWGDFVNEETEIIYTDEIESQGTAFSPFVLGGTELRISSRAALVLEGRYEWGRDDLGTDFRGFEPMDLSGTRLTAGLSYRF